MNAEEQGWIAFSSFNRVGLIHVDGTGEHYLEFPVPDQARWALGPLFVDGRRIIATSYEDLTIAKLVVGEVSTRTWIYDLYTGNLDEILAHGRFAPFQYCHTLLPGEQRLGVNVMLDGEERIFLADLDGGNPQELTRPGDGFCYGVALSPSGDRLAFHVTGGKFENDPQPLPFRPAPYSINTLDLFGPDRTLVAGAPGHLYFGPTWSPDGEWLAYLDCHSQSDPAHFWADLCIGRPDGSEHRVVTSGQSHWFGTSFGLPENRGGGSNIPHWMPNGKYLTYTRVAPGSHPDCEYHPELPDHCELVYNPAVARGGAQVCLLNPFNGEIKEVTPFVENQWDFRAAPSPDGTQVLFTRACVGQASELWIADIGGQHPRLLTRGLDNRGADFGRWLA